MLTQDEHIGPGKISNLAGVLRQRHSQKLLLVHGHQSYETLEPVISPILHQYHVISFSNFSGYPTSDSVWSAIEYTSGQSFDTVIALGGGRVIDMAKLIIAFSQVVSPEHLSRALNGHFDSLQRVPTFIAIPCTAGSGSEATHFAVLFDGQNKKSIAHPNLKPDVAIVDSRLTATAPKQIAASSGMDALSQAIESYWANKATQQSRGYAQQSIEAIFEHLAGAVEQPDEVNTTAVAMGAHMAGKAIDISKTTAPHAISYPMMSRFGVPHGQAVALTLPAILEYNCEADETDLLHPAGSTHYREIMEGIITAIGATTCTDARQRLHHLLNRIGLATRLRDVGITSTESLQYVVSNSFDTDRMANNPRAVTPASLSVILNDIR